MHDDLVDRARQNVGVVRPHGGRIQRLPVRNDADAPADRGERASPAATLDGLPSAEVRLFLEKDGNDGDCLRSLCNGDQGGGGGWIPLPGDDSVDRSRYGEAVDSPLQLLDLAS